MKEHDDGLLAPSGSSMRRPPINFNVEALGNCFWQLTIDGLAYGSIYALVAVGYTLVYGVLRLINFAHSEIFMLGMFGQYAVLMMLGFAPSGNVYDEGIAADHLCTSGSRMLGGMVVSGGAAVGLERVAYRPLRKRDAPSLVFLITAIGASFVIQEFVHYVLPKLTDGELGGVNAQAADPAGRTRRSSSRSSAPRSPTSR